MSHVRIQQPAIGFDNPFWLRPREDIDLNQAIKEVLESAKSALPGRITHADGLRMGEIEFEKRINVCLGKLGAVRDMLIHQEGVELARAAQDASARAQTVASCLKVSGEAVEVRT